MSEAIRDADIKEFRKLARAMDRLMRRICEYNPEANLYIEDAGNANLMSGPTHDDNNNLKPMYENVAAHEHILRASGGGW